MGGLPAGAGGLVGKRLGNYDVVALLAVGGTAEIYLARIGGAAGFEKYVVVKCLHDHLAEDPEFVQMFLDEARVGAQLAHSNIVQTLALIEQAGRYYLVMEFLIGMSLSLIGRRAIDRVPGGRIPVPLVLGIAAQACTGLHYAHDRTAGGAPMRLVHRDVSPQNLVIGFEGVVKVVDFGIAKSDGRSTQTQAGTIKGKFAYMSPEQCLSKDVDRRTDVFALGVVVHELLTGKRLFKRGSAYDTYQAILGGDVPPPSAVNRSLDPELDPVVLRALAANPDERYPSAEAFGEALVGYLHSHGGHASAGDIARFLEQYFGKEIDEHTARMRDLLAGRPDTSSESLLSWDGDPESAQLNEPDGDESTPVESLVFAAGLAAGHRAPSNRPARAATDEPPREFQEIGTSDVLNIDDDDEGGEATRIETNPLAEILAKHQELAAQRASADAARPRPSPGPSSSVQVEASHLEPGRTPHLEPGREPSESGRAPSEPGRARSSSQPGRAKTEPGRAKTESGRAASEAGVIADGSQRMSTIPEPPRDLPPVPPPPAIVRTPPGLRDLGPRGFPAAHVPTVIAAEPSAGVAAPLGQRRGFAVAPDARTELHGPAAAPGAAPQVHHHVSDAPTLLNAPSPFAGGAPGMPAAMSTTAPAMPYLAPPMPGMPPPGMPMPGMLPTITPSGTPAGTPAAPSANPEGAPAMMDLPLPAHLIGFGAGFGAGVGAGYPGYPEPGQEASPQPRVPPRLRTWLLTLAFLGAVLLALLVTIALARALR